MTDPFHDLSAPVEPIDPDPRFATRLRARLVRALALPEGVDMPRTVLAPPPLDTTPVASPGLVAATPGHGDVSYASLWVPDVEVAAVFYAEVLGWRYAEGSAPQGRRVEGVDPPLGLWGGQKQRTMFLCFVVDDVPAAVARVRASGGRAEEPRDEPYGLVADCVDDQGMAFSLSQAGDGAVPAGGASGPRQGELAYLTLGVADTTRAQAFFGAVLGWHFAPGRMEGGWSIEGLSLTAGMYGGAATPLVTPMYAVDDIDAGVQRVRRAGGRATDPERMPYGITSDCVDNQGSSFYLGQL